MEFKYLVVYTRDGMTGMGNSDVTWHNQTFTLPEPVTEDAVNAIRMECKRNSYRCDVTIVNIIPLAG